VGAGAARSGALLRRFDVRRARCFDQVVRRRAGAARPPTREGHGRAGVRGVRRPTECVARSAQHVVRARRRRDHGDTGIRGGGSPPRWSGRASRRAGRDRRRPPVRWTARRAARLPQHVAGDGPLCAPPTPAAGRSGAARAGRGGRTPACARGWRRRRGRGRIRAGRIRPRADGRRVHPQRSRRPTRLWALVLERRRDALEHCAAIDDGRVCVLEYNVVRWGETELPPEAGVVVYVRGESGRLAAARIYDDTDPPLESARPPSAGTGVR
jgi:hypothetical protein